MKNKKGPQTNQAAFMKLVESARSSHNKVGEQELLEMALECFPHWEWAKDAMKKLTEYWRHCYTEYEGKIDPLQYKKICVFAHHDANKKIADYVLYLCKALLEWGCAIIFISNCETLPQEEITKIHPFTSKIIVRPNQGHDFGSYYIGLDIAKRYDHHQYLIFMNDSVMGPVNELTLLDEHLPKGKEFLGIFAAHRPVYYIQSYFLMFPQTMHHALSLFFEQFAFIKSKNQIIFKGEIGLSQFLISQGYIPKVFSTENKRFFDAPYLITHIRCPLIKKYLGAQEELKEPLRSMVSFSHTPLRYRSKLVFHKSIHFTYGQWPQ